MTRLPGHLAGLCAFLFIVVLSAAPAAGQTTWTVVSQAELLTALRSAAPGDTIRFGANITLSSELPNILINNLTIDGAGFTLSGANQYRGLILGDVSAASVPIPVSVSIQNLTISNTVVSGGAGASSVDGGGGGGAGLGGAIFIANSATVTLAGVNITSSVAVGGTGGGASGPGGGGAGGVGTGYFGWGGSGGRLPSPGGYGGGGGGTTIANAGAGSTFAGGTGSTIGGGGGGAGLGGAIFVQGGGALSVIGPLSINGNSVTGGPGGVGATSGSAYGTGLFLGGFGVLLFAPAAGQSVTIGDTIVDRAGLTGDFRSGSWGLAKDGEGTLTLSGANLYSGGTQVYAGTLRVASDANLGTPDSYLGLYATSTLAITGNSTFARGLFLDGTPTISVGSGVSATWAGAISEEVGTALRVSGGGSLTLLNTQNSYSGGTIVTGGSSVVVGADAALGDIATLTLGDAVSSGTLGVMPGTSMVTARPVALGAGGGIFDVRGASLLTLTGPVSGTGTLSKAGTGMLVLSSATSHTGGTNVNAGTLQAGLSNVFVPASALTVAGGATFDANNFTQTIGSLAGAGSVTLGSATLTTGGANTDTTFSGAITGAGSLVKTGAGAFTLLGANSYSGGTLVSGGTLRGTTTSLQGAIANNAAVVFDQGTNGTYAGVMTGTGSLTKSGTGSVTLTGANSYSGGTLVSGGMLIGSTSSLQGNVVDHATLVFDQAGAGTFAGAISGTGALIKSGAGTVTLNGTNTYTGSTSITGGVLRAGTSSVFSTTGSISIGAGTTLDLNGFSHTLNSLSGPGTIALGNATLTTGADGGSFAFAGSITGSGSLVKAGGGTLTLLGANMYSGGTTVSGGTLVGNSSSLQGNILNNSRVIFDQGFNGTYAGSMSGSGAFEKAGGGALTLTGTHTYTGGTLISGGSLIGTTASLTGLIVANGGLVFTGSASGTFNGTLAGSGTMTKAGSGTVTLNGSHSFGGLTTVSEGALALNGVLGGNVTVAPNAIFRATGSVLGTLNVNGTLSVPAGSASLTGLSSGAPSAASAGDRLNTTPLLTIGGNFVAGPGSVVELPIASGPNPSILVGGAAALNGTLLDASPINLGTQRSLSFLALRALDSLSVANTAVDTNDPLLISTLRQDGTSLFVTMLNLGVPIATSVDPAFASVGAAIDGMKRDMSGDRGFVVRELLALPDDQLNDALRAIAGELHASNRHIAIRSSEAFTDLIRSEMTEREHEAEDGARGWGGQKLRWFGQFAREHSGFDPDRGALGGAIDLNDGAGGFEYKLSDRFLVGGGGGFGSGSMSLDGLAAGSDYTAPRAFGVVGFKPKAFSLRGGGSFSRSKATSKRRIVIIALLPPEFGGLPLSGGIDREARSEEVTVQNDQWSEYADNQDFGTYRLDYMFGVRRARFARDGFTETGAGALSLRSPGDTINLTDTDVKIHLWRRKGAVRPYVETLVRRSSGFEYTLPVEFAEDQDSDFETAGLPLGQNAFAGRMGVTFVRRIGSLTVEYRFRKASGQTVQSGDLRFRF